MKPARRRLTNGVKTRTENATVRFLRRSKRGVVQPVAQGVLVPGGFILTAAHCIDWVGTGSMTLGDWYIEKIRARNGSEYNISPYVVEPMLDIAALGALDSQEFSEQARLRGILRGNGTGPGGRRVRRL
jgi:hypothetical protein